jgi:hypothetical protein
MFGGLQRLNVLTKLCENPASSKIETDTDQWHDDLISVIGFSI